MTLLAPIIATAALLALLASSRQDEPEPTQDEPKPKKRTKRGRITSSTRDRFDTVQESPRELLAQARRRVDDSITLDELTGARLIASELSRGTPEEMAAIVDAELNRSERKGRKCHRVRMWRYGECGRGASSEPWGGRGQTARGNA